MVVATYICRVSRVSAVPWRDISDTPILKVRHPKGSMYFDGGANDYSCEVVNMGEHVRSSFLGFVPL